MLFQPVISQDLQNDESNLNIMEKIKRIEDEIYLRNGYEATLLR